MQIFPIYCYRQMVYRSDRSYCRRLKSADTVAQPTIISSNISSVVILKISAYLKLKTEKKKTFKINISYLF